MISSEEIRKYINGELSEEQKKRIENLAVNDPEMADTLREEMLIASAASAVKEDELIKRMQKLETSTSHQSNRSSSVWRWAAAVVVISLSTYFLLSTGSSSSSEQLFDQYFEPYQNVVGQSRGNEEVEFLKYYDTQDYENAIEELSTYLKKNPGDETAHFYLGVSYLATGKAKNSINQFSTISDSSRFSTQVRWYTALAHIANEDADLAKPILKELINTGSSYSKKAEDLLGALD